MVKKILGITLRWGLMGLCLFLLFRGLDWIEFWESLKKLGFVPVLLAVLFSLIQYVPVAMRFNFLTKFRAGFLTALKASVFCLGINNLFPAKLGEVAKAFYLRKKTGIQLGEGLGLIFWERLFDLNMLMVVGLIAAASMGRNEGVLLLGLTVVGLWAFVIALRINFKIHDLVLKIVPGQRLKLVASDVMHQLRNGMSASFFLSLFLYSLVSWFLFAAMYFVVLWGVGGLEISAVQVLSVFAIATLGYAVPASPGGLGIFEWAFVTTLGAFDVTKGPALACALVMRFCIYVPPVLAALWVMAQSGMSLKGIREQQAETL
ncbi:lysylphosphatidylglycerol synthase transmembrane domain-containing protein [Oceanidesulfovibrio indonesiensis]|nr:lysylphosphatidylglycerol synthase transmembrane domain-containing protein [Oceanidesulfovibrio indonesiensis]